MSREIITSAQNPRVRAAAKLRDRRDRQEHGLFLIDGVRELGLALKAGVKLHEVFCCPALCRGDDALQLLGQLETTGAKILESPAAVFEKLAFGNRAEGLLAVAVTRSHTLDDLQLPPAPLVAVVEEVEKPGNLGAVLRSADGAGISALIVTDRGADLYNPNAIRASLGTVFTVPVATASLEEAIAWLKTRRLAIFCTRPDAQRLYTAADFRLPAAIVFGSEARGLSPAWNPISTAIRVPMAGSADSLNVSAAAAVLFYEARRQRGMPTT